MKMAYAEKPVRLSKHDQGDVYAAAHKILSQKKYNWARHRDRYVSGRETEVSPQKFQSAYSPLLLPRDDDVLVE